jgi:outer membrane protein assembly factor BamB
MTSRTWVLTVLGSIMVIVLFAGGGFSAFFIPCSSAVDTKPAVFVSADFANSRTLSSPNAQIDGDFGDSVATSGNFVVVGAPQEQGSNGLCGVVYIFTGIQIIQRVRTLTNPNPNYGGSCDTCCPPQFGASVAISGTTVVVGAAGITGKGAAYVFNATTGTLISTLKSPNADPSFGTSVSIGSNNIVVVGAPYAEANGHDYVGAAYAYNAQTGKLLRTFSSPHPVVDGLFGNGVGISCKTIVVGAPSESANKYQGAGRAYVFNVTTGSLVTTLVSPNSQNGGSFGWAVAISGKTIVVGAAFEGTSGRAYVFIGLKTIELITTLSSPNPSSDGQFGISVALSGNTALVGAIGENVRGIEGAGRAYAFNIVTGSLMETFVSPNAQTAGAFGIVAMSNKAILIGASGENANGLESAGHAYVFF